MLRHLAFTRIDTNGLGWIILFNNDKLPLLFLENQNAQVAVKTPNGLSPRVNIQNIVMQGSVWGSLFCTTTMDKLGQLAYENSELLYIYKGLGSVPPICMVDDIQLYLYLSI